MSADGATRPRVIPEEAVPGQVLPDLARWAVSESRILTEESSPMRAAFLQGDPRLLLVVGENASGKSLVFRMIAGLADRHGILAMTLSIRERTGGGLFAMAHMRRAMIYGDEETSSTGAVSASVVKRGFDNMRERDGPCILALDEPELGLSDGYAAALGELIGANAAEAGPMACGTIVVTHSRELARGLMRGLGAAPSMIAMTTGGVDAPCGVDAWIESREDRSVDDLLRLADASLDRFRRVQRILDAGRN